MTTLDDTISAGQSGHIGDHEQIADVLGTFGSPFSRVALDGQGTLAARPAAGVQGRYYYATDVGFLYRDTGAAWVAFASTGRKACKVVKATSTVPDAGAIIHFDGPAVFDPLVMHSATVNETRLTVPAGYAGLWDFTGQVEWQGYPTGWRGARIRVNGATDVGIVLLPCSDSAHTFVAQVIAQDVPLSAGDFVEIFAYQDTGASLNLPLTTLTAAWRSA
jgi:hypothetical protein